MKITKIKSKDGKKVDVAFISSLISKYLDKVGYCSNVSKITSSSFILSGNSCSFTVNQNILGHNLRVNKHKSLTGYKRTLTPTWNQRVDYNLIIIEFFNQLGLTCKILSGSFIIKDGSVDFNEDNWQDQKPYYITQNERNGYGIIIPMIDTYKEMEKQAKRDKRRSKKKNM